MPLPTPPLSSRILVIAGLVVASAAALVLLVRYALARRAAGLNRGG